MKTLLVTHHDLRQLVASIGIDALMDEMIARLTDALVNFDAAETDIPIRTGFNYEGPTVGLVEWMPVHESGAITLKIVGYHPDNPDDHGLPTVLSTISRYTTDTGHLQALIDGTFMTAIRTGAASAVATRALARSGSRTLGLVGCGAQAVTQLHAIGRLFDIDEVLIHDTDAAAMDSLPARVRSFGGDRYRMRAATPEAIVAESDIISVATSVDVGGGPVLPATEHRPWLHVNAVGSDFPGKIEVPRSFLDASLVCADFLGQARQEGECQQLDSLDDVVEFVDVVKRHDAYADARERPTVFDSTGWALEDRVSMELVLEHVRRLGLGTEVEIESVTADPRHPYEMLDAMAAERPGDAGSAARSTPSSNPGSNPSSNPGSSPASSRVARQ
ncbi:MAG: ornithine cyclodeaminase family protein [Phycisphaerales bacterium]